MPIIDGGVRGETEDDKDYAQEEKKKSHGLADIELHGALDYQNRRLSRTVVESTATPSRACSPMSSAVQMRQRVCSTYGNSKRVCRAALRLTPL